MNIESPSLSDSTPLYAGVSRRDITTDAPDAVINDRLYARALVLRRGELTFVLVTMDVTAIGARAISDGALPDVSEDFLPTLRAKLQAELGIQAANVMVNASHTHPLGRMLCDDDQQIRRVFDAIREASERMVEVRVGSAVGREDRITLNRTVRLKDGRNWTIRHANPSPPDADVESVGPIDPDVGVIRVDRAGGRPLAVVYNFASHLLFGDPDGKVTANFPGVASRLIEESFGDEVMAFFVQGAAGDVIDVDFKNFDRPRDVEQFGIMLGSEVVRTARSITASDRQLKSARVNVEFPRRTDLPARIEALQRQQAELIESLRSLPLNFESFLPLFLKYRLRSGSPSDYSYRYRQAERLGSDAYARMDRFVAAHVDKYVQNIRAMEELARCAENIATLQKHLRLNAEAGSATVSAELQALRLGDCILVAAPLEVLTEVALKLKRASPIAKTFIAGFSNGYLHYGPPPEAYDRGGYEVNECLLAPEWASVFHAAALRLIDQTL